MLDLFHWTRKLKVLLRYMPMFYYLSVRPRFTQHRGPNLILAEGCRPVNASCRQSQETYNEMNI